MPPRRQAAPKQESKTGLVVALVFFILTTIALGAMTYVGFDGQKELETKATAATKERDDSRKDADGARAKLMANQIMMGTADKAPAGEDLGRLNSNEEFRKELAQILKSFNTVGVTWDPKTDAPPESVKVVMQRIQQERDTEKANAAAAYAARDKAKSDFEAKEAAEVAKTKQAQEEQQKAAKTTAAAQVETQEAKTFQVNEIKKVADVAKAAATKAADDIANRDVKIKRQEEDIAGKTETIRKYTGILDAARAKILLTDVKHGQVTQVDTTSDTAFISLGSADNIRSGMSFSVLQNYDKNTAGPEDALPKKASLTVVQILGPKSSRCTVKYAEDVNSTKDPVRSGDALYKPGWKSGTPIRWALAGHFDLNGLGRDETLQLKKILERQGIVVDAYLDLSSLKVIGELNHGIDYLIVGNRPTGETARVIGEERKEAIEKAINDMQAKAREMGIATMQHRIFLPIAGIDLPRQQGLPYFPGGGAGGAPSGEKPSEDKPKGEKKDEGK